MFLSVPIFQSIFPGTGSLGAIVGSIKVGSVSRGISSTISTWENINWRLILRCWPVLLGSVFGAMTISHVSTNLILPILVLAVLVSANPKRLSRFMLNSQKFAFVILLMVGAYAGFFGAGISLLLLAAVRVADPDLYGADHQIVSSSIQVRFLELITASIAIAGHILAGTVSLENAQMWLWWGIGMAIGGFIGGLLLVRLQAISPWIQKTILFLSFAIALGTALRLQLGL